MILQIKKNSFNPEMLSDDPIYKASHIKYEGNDYLVFSSKLKKVPDTIQDIVEQIFHFDTDFQLSSYNFTNGKKRAVSVNNSQGDIVIGGKEASTILITGPCSVESESQIREVAQYCVSQNVRILRAGAFKPRTSPYSFQGLGLEGLELLAKMREEYGLSIISEAKDASHIDAVIEHVDMIQVGAKAMYDQGILRACSKTDKPVLIKRGFGSTLQETVQAAEFVLAGGNPNVMLCERGIRTFVTKTRFTLDLCGVAWLKEHCNLPLILDPSHAMGYRYGVADLSRACFAMGQSSVKQCITPPAVSAPSSCMIRMVSALAARVWIIRGFLQPIAALI